MSTTRLPPVATLEASSAGWGFFLCARKDVRSGKSGDYLALVLQDVSGEIRAKVFQDVPALKDEFAAGDFVKVHGRGNAFNQRVELVLDKIRRVMPERDALEGFREELCIQCSPRPVDDMWAQLQARIGEVVHPQIRLLLETLVARHGDRLRIWPAARTVHHAYRSGLLEHILKIMDVVVFLAETYGARRDLVIAGALLHDLGKLHELTYDATTGYSVEGNLVGHITMGVGMLRDALRDQPDFPADLALELQHLVVSHHGLKELGSPVEPMTVEAFMLAAADDLDAKIHQIRRHVDDDDSEGPFTAYHARLQRVFLKPSSTS